MAIVSPGVNVSVIDESFYTPAEPGTVPMIFVATAQDKTSSTGTGTAEGTTAANAGRVYLLSSQRELAETFGDPVFKTNASNNPIHGGETNEYGLQAAYSFLGVANRAYVVRADVDLGQLEASANAPAANPATGTYWFDTANTRFGIFEWNGSAATVTGGQSFTNQIPTVITSTTQLSSGLGSAPKTSVGSIGDYAITATDTNNDMWYKQYDGSWVAVGTANWVASKPTIAGGTPGSFLGGQNFAITINGVTTTITASGTTITDIASDISGAGVSGLSARVNGGKLDIHYNGSNDDKVQIADGTMTIATALGITAGIYYVPALSIAPHTSVPAFKSSDPNPRPTGSLWIKTTDPNLGAKWSVKKFNGTTKLFEDVSAPLYASNESALFNLDKTGGGLNIAVGGLYVNSGNGTTETDFVIHRRENTGSTTVTSSAVATGQGAGSKSFTIAESIVGQEALNSGITVTVTTNNNAADADVIAGGINGAGFTNIVASVDSQNRVVISHNDGGEFKITDTNGLIEAIGLTNTSTNMGFEPGTTAATNPKQFRASNWKVLTYTASATAVTSLTTNGQLWYSSVVDEVDIMVHNGTTFKGYKQVYANTDPAGPQVSASAPTTQSDGTALVENDLWISTANLEEYADIYRWNANSLKWEEVDSSDQTTENGIVFADARFGTSGGTATAEPTGTIAELLDSDFLDPDAPDPALYPKGILLWNLRRSGFNVKKFVRNSIDTTATNPRQGGASMSTYYPHRWVTESANQANGAGSFGRKAQRKVIVQGLQALVNSNQDIRDDESRLFNVMATPGYPELIGEMVSLNSDRGLSAFIIGDSPFRLTPDSTSLNNWATNVNKAVEDNDQGLVTSNSFLGVFYPSGFTSDNFGNNIVVPASHMMLRTIALSDQVSFPWFAPAGTRRGGITNASSTGYINSEGEFVSTALNEGQRDTLYTNKVNPITFITGAGLVNFGQKTRFAGTSSLDRINVARLVIFLRSQLNKLARPFVFEPNDKITRDEIKAQAESLLLELVGNRAIFDFLVVCDESNNTPTRIDRNELYLDIAIEPVKAVEFIYIPLRLKNTGEIAGL
tara:strand:+ start:4353 stop:7586 length:3234 start_codon:yes stop_codon:yes gene_type:complete